MVSANQTSRQRKPPETWSSALLKTLKQPIRRWLKRRGNELGIEYGNSSRDSRNINFARPPPNRMCIEQLRATLACFLFREETLWCSRFRLAYAGLRGCSRK